jgi:hypothetical protein
VEGTGSGKPTISGPFFRIAIKEGATEKNDEIYGQYLEGSDGGESSGLSRTRYITVKAGTTYTFGGYFGSPLGEWVGKTVDYQVTYTCFGS